MTEANPRLRIAMAQINLWVGDIAGNVDKIVECSVRARDQLHADVVVFPELALLGYPPDDLLMRSGLPAYIQQGLERVRAASEGIHIVVGYPEYTEKGMFNAAAVFLDGKRIGNYRKQRRPNYGVFDEKRHFLRGWEPCVLEMKGIPVGVTICEDLWGPRPAQQAKVSGASLLINLNASPFQIGKSAQRAEVLRARVQESGLSIIYVNVVGGQDEILFDGDSMVYDREKGIIFRAADFEEGLYLVEADAQGRCYAVEPPAPILSAEGLVYRGLVQSIRDYVDRNGFKGALIGLSGGIDSALTLALSVDALGPDRVWAVSMPSRYTAEMSVEDALEQATALNARCDVIDIEQAFQAFLQTLGPHFSNRGADLTEENLQARCRGILLMALSNKYGYLVLTTGNKSEMAVGYATLYGDMAGGFAPLKDVYKTLVYRLAEWRNRQSEVHAIPPRVITRPPSAELRPDQTDQDSLPPYDTLDRIIEAYVEENHSIPQICALGFDEVMVRRIAGLIRKSEYKRRQSPPGPKITARAFGRDRRYPITAVYGDF
jgi:NAD+ synthase (glutamine-hydrolysing)